LRFRILLPPCSSNSGMTKGKPDFPALFNNLLH
jgi:hypothetical protein